MIVEERVYTLHPGKLGEYLQRYEAEGLNVQLPILGRMLGYYSTEIGPLNTIVHMWAYQDLAERGARRARMLADPRWIAYAKTVQPLIVSQESRILNPAPFFAARLAAMLASGLPLRESGAALGLTYHTARTYLDRIYRKTGTSHQAGLVALLKAVGVPN